MGTVYAIANQNGGVGKTTTAVNLGACASGGGHKTLLVDLDPQCNATVGLGLAKDIEPNIYDCLAGEATLAAAAKPTAVRDLERVPATPDLAKTDLALRNIYFTEVNNTSFQIGTSPSLPPQFSLDLSTNALVLGSAISQSLFTALPTPTTTPTDATAFDWTPQGASAIATGGMSSFSGRILERAGSFVTATTYRGAADPSGAKWWAKWTVYLRG